MKINRFAIVLPVSALLLSACGTDGAPQADAPTVTVTETVTAPADDGEAEVAEEAKAAKEEKAAEEEAAPEPTEEVEPEGDTSEGQASFGDTWTWEDGLEITVSEPEAFKPGEYSAGGEGYDSHVKFDVTIENKSGEPFDASLVYLTMQSGTSEGEEVFDDGLEGSPSTTLLDGRKVTFTSGFGVEDPSDLVLEVTPDFEYDAALFTN